MSSDLVQSLDPLGRRGNRRDDSAEILFQFQFQRDSGPIWRRPLGAVLAWAGVSTLLDVVHPAFPPLITALPIVRGALKDGLGKAVQNRASLSNSNTG